MIDVLCYFIFLTRISSSSKIVPVLKLSMSDPRESVVSNDDGEGETVLVLSWPESLKMWFFVTYRGQFYHREE